MVYRSLSELDFTLADLPSLPSPRRILMTSPEFFDIRYVINPHMAGHIGDVDSEAAQRQWNALKKAYSDLGYEADIVDGLSGLPDMVFCANQTLPFRSATTEHVHTGGDRTESNAIWKGVILSHMYAPERMKEVACYEAFFEQPGYETVHLESSIETSFEGMGDAIWHPSRYLLWGGYGFRTDASVYSEISDLLRVHILAIELTDPEFYHLDTCLSVLDEKTALIYPGAFQVDGLALIRAFFEHVIESPENEARSLFSCNAHSPDGKNVLIQAGCSTTNRLLVEAGFNVVELETSEFLKAGGSVFCMKQMFW